MRRLESVAGRIGIENADERLSWPPRAQAELEMSQRRSRQGVGRAVGQILFADAAEIRLQEALTEPVASLRSGCSSDRLASARGRGDFLDQGKACRGDTAQEPAIVR